MDVTPRKFVLVIGTSWASSAKQQVARMIGTTLAEAGLGLICGDSTSVDHWVADSFCAELGIAGSCPRMRSVRFRSEPGVSSCEADCRGVDFVRQDHAAWRCMTWRPGSAKRSPAATPRSWSGAGVARWNSVRIIGRGKPVFPLPFMSRLTGNSDTVFQEILGTWERYPVPGVPIAVSEPRRTVGGRNRAPGQLASRNAGRGPRYLHLLSTKRRTSRRGPSRQRPGGAFRIAAGLSRHQRNRPRVAAGIRRSNVP